MPGISLLVAAAPLFLSEVALAQFSQQGPKLVGVAVTGAAAEQGQSVSLSSDGNTAIVGAPFDDNGGAWVYTRSGGVWTLQSKLVDTERPGADSVSLSSDGNTAIVGKINMSASGDAWVYTRSGSVWTLQDKLVGMGTIGTGQHGWSVSLSNDGNTAIVGGPEDNGTIGAAWVYTRSGGVWIQQGKLVGREEVIGGSSLQGWSVSLSSDGNTAIVGGPDDNNRIGAAWVYARSGSVWTQQSKLVGTGAIGAAQQGSGVSLSSDGNTAIVGGPSDNSSIGAAWVYTRSGSVWTQQSKLVGTGAIGAAQQGSSVSLSFDGNTAIVGGPGDNGGPGGGPTLSIGIGAAWVYTRGGSVWTQQSKLVGTGAIGSSAQGVSVSLSSDSNTAIVGGSFDNDPIGAAWVYAKD
jgi:lipocalin